MTKFKALFTKGWVFAAAAALIIGSSSAMAFALDNNIPEQAATNPVPYTVAANETTQNQATITKDTAAYTVVDQSKETAKLKEAIQTKLSYIKDITPEEIEKKYNEIIANMTPSEKDITAEQAAAYGADILKKAYGVDFTGYTASASFYRSPMPNSDSWTVIFNLQEAAQNNEQNWNGTSYIAVVDSVNGTMQHASYFDRTYETVTSKNLEDPAWIAKAEEAVSKFKPENASITNSKIVFTHPEGGVIAVCELSDGSAYAVRMEGENKNVVVYIFFPNGYDGSLDYKPVTEKGLG